MKVKAWSTVDVECEVDVSLDDCINEMMERTGPSEGPHRKLSAIDGATKIMEAITPDMVGELLAKNPKAVEIIKSRLQKWIERL